MIRILLLPPSPNRAIRSRMDDTSSILFLSRLSGIIVLVGKKIATPSSFLVSRSHATPSEAFTFLRSSFRIPGRNRFHAPASLIHPADASPEMTRRSPKSSILTESGGFRILLARSRTIWGSREMKARKWVTTLWFSTPDRETTLSGVGARRSRIPDNRYLFPVRFASTRT